MLTVMRGRGGGGGGPGEIATAGQLGLAKCRRRDEALWSSRVAAMELYGAGNEDGDNSLRFLQAQPLHAPLRPRFH
ncbi:hypothetical protein TIFTF001_045005 [Ficus carica]|uniref:Uncharacterized protein n=1 Tax=Ficus carica TaxID=3494 RepID=A0AA88CX87_FICCA|nr:hypothetical protein TIFTF001_045002 [Ficus carica]GMN35341.1 hypothetical protein TIFTF001_045005 [Ficus carica]